MNPGVTYPGDRLSYETIERWRGLLPSILALLEAEEHREIAAFEMIWRVYEYSLELGSVENALSSLEDHARTLGEPWLLFSECYLHRYSSLRDTGLHIVSDSEVSSAIVTAWSNAANSPPSIVGREALTDEQLRFTLFHELLQDSIPLLDSAENARNLIQLGNERHVELDKLKKTISKSVIEMREAKSNLREAYDDILSRLVRQIEEIANLDRRKAADLFNQLTTDKTLWSTIASLLGSVLGSMPAVVPAALALAAFCSLGPEALKARRAVQKERSDSPCSFVYYARRARDQ